MLNRVRSVNLGVLVELGSATCDTLYCRIRCDGRPLEHMYQTCQFQMLSRGFASFLYGLDDICSRQEHTVQDSFRSFSKGVRWF